MSVPIVAERRAADALKRDTPIIAIFGNPPYRRLDAGEEAAITSGWDNGFWDDLKAPVRDAGWGGELNTFPDLYIAFWRWCLWKLFESDGAPRRGVVCLITNRTFLAGHPYAGLRRMLRQRFDSIDIVDLRGDSRGARPAGIETDECVFAIQAGVCIVIALAHGGSGEARVRYADAWRHDAFTERQKLDLLVTASTDEAALTFVDVQRDELEDFVPSAFQSLLWPALVHAFGFRSSGVQTKRDEFVYGFSAAALTNRWKVFSSLSEDEAARTLHETSMVTVAGAKSVPLAPTEIGLVIYRPLDRRYLMRANRLIDRPRPDLEIAWGQSNTAIYALPSGTGAGPSVWVHGLLPDYHAFRGSYGG